MLPVKRIIFRMTPSERLAVLSVLLEHWGQCDHVTEEFIDCSASPPQTVKYGDLLTMFSRMDVEIEEANDVEQDAS